MEKQTPEKFSRDAVVYRLFKNSKRLVKAHLDLTYRCELDCIHCYLEDRSKPGPSKEIWLDVIDQLHEMGVFMVMLSGGEVFLRPDIWEILARLKKHRFQVQVKTHGVRVDAAFAQRIKDAGVHRMDVSLYSDKPGVHDAFTRRPGSQRRTLAAVDNLTKVGIPVKINNTVTKQNLGSDIGIRKIAEARGLQHSSNFRIHPYRDGDTLVYGLQIPIYQSMDTAARKRLRRAEEKARFKKEGGLVRTPPPKRLKDRKICGAGTSTLYIDPDGNITPCVAWPETLGNVKRDRINDVWQKHERLKYLSKRRSDVREGCQGCAYMQNCQFCPGLAFLETGGNTNPARTTCRSSEAVFLAKKQIQFGGPSRKVFIPVAKLMSNGERAAYLDREIRGDNAQDEPARGMAVGG